MSLHRKTAFVCAFTLLTAGMIGCANEPPIASLTAAFQPSCPDCEYVFVTWTETALDLDGEPLPLDSSIPIDEAWLAIDAGSAACDVDIDPTPLTFEPSSTSWQIDDVAVPSACHDASSTVVLWIRQGSELSSFDGHNQ